MNKKIFGKAGEDMACTYLEKNNYQIVERNFYYRGGEIDIIALDECKKEFVFIEVKTRASNKYGLPSEAVDTRKIKHIIRGIKYYLHVHKLEQKFIRIDVIEMYYKNKKFLLNHIKQVL